MICWSCEREGGGGPLCAACGTVLPAEDKQDRFAVLGVPRKFSVDLSAAEGNFKKLSRQVHPDRFATADPRARKAALSRTVQLNEAWRTLKDPLRRAEYLLELAGFGLKGDDRKREDAATREVSAPPVLLMEILELREELADAQRAGNTTKVQSMANTMRARHGETLAALAAALDDGGAGKLEEAARLMVALRYYQRFLDEVPAGDAPHGGADEAAHG
ncbi:MAG TPA: Fe-S protein assembly co-chaperone HscB [Polyangia bacterium]|nr:Fe-S protein assembly co-chaperone HscB [Polyangia bacterium]